ncbi:glycosyl transferase family 2 [Brevibacterium sanguinis]|uniref:Glycosyl transferase family 2 n=2 Tax=Brevibacterium TaxID=1696 RepID=A0A366IIV4_9MICO|nr:MULTISPECIES: glycosyltransferase family A protein [Brevibacterium]RBP65447.1 glycosyl transferase family 2 [Brevibacterium sanguinis]RBP72081.1 glycosyl transferase family 2 [Brevibacterium celere]
MTAVARSSADWGAPVPPRTGPHLVDVLIPTCDRPTELAVTLSGLAAQTDADLGVVISDQSSQPVADHTGVAPMLTLLTAQGRSVRVERNLPRRGMAQQRQRLLDLSEAPRVLYLDDDVWLEPGTIARMLTALEDNGCGFIGSAVQGLSFLDDRRPGEWEEFAEWEGRVEPETLTRTAEELDRWKLHNAANLCHIAVERGYTTPRTYHVAWVGGCVLFDRAKLVEAGGFEFWDQVPRNHVGEDVWAQWQVMRRFGGAGLIPSGAVHLESPTTLPRRDHEVAEVLEPETA